MVWCIHFITNLSPQASSFVKLNGTPSRLFVLPPNNFVQIVIAGVGKFPVNSIELDVLCWFSRYFMTQFQDCQVVMKIQDKKINRVSKSKISLVQVILDLRPILLHHLHISFPRRDKLEVGKSQNEIP